MSPRRLATRCLATRGLSTSLTRSSLNKRVNTTPPKITSTALLKRVRFPKLRISSLYHTTSHYCLRPKNLLNALPRLKKQTWTTNKFVLCWLHHGTCRSEKQVRNDRRFVVKFNSKSEFLPAQGNLWHGFYFRKDWDNDFSEREQPAVWRGNESVFRDAEPANVANSLLEGNRDHMLTQARSELMKEEHKVESLSNCTCCKDTHSQDTFV